MVNKGVGAFVCLTIIALDITAGILGIRAEAAQNQEKHLRLWLFECKQPSEDAYRLGFAAIVLLIIAHVLANLLSGCTACSHEEIHKASLGRQLSLLSLFFTWIILAVALGMLVIGTKANHKSNASCGLSHHHFLSIGGILCFVHSLFSIAYYVTATASIH
ncbi:protein VASCULATURE COMPLEXITY AND CONNECTIVITY-like [Rutidosis leptorrhynchoides]|uniref:protein VASCULATURE COMPLEXITY AND CONNECTIVITY-like n=1 Tax=Rutidosis leptorrhynchoides TaxID=125765 RepID=UPI003A998324